LPTPPTHVMLGDGVQSAHKVTYRRQIAFLALKLAQPTRD
jgi:hypothetical protein